MDNTSNDDAAKSTKNRLLDAAEQLYTLAGQENLSLRDLTDLAGVNLAAVNYHFGSKNALVCAMAARRLDRVNEARLTDLRRLENVFREKLRCEHIFGALAAGLMKPGFDITQSLPQCDFSIRIGSDLSQPLRQFLTQRYAHVEDRFLLAFSRVTPWLRADEVTWRINSVAFALPGIAINANTQQLIRKAAFDRAMSKIETLASLSITVGALMNSPAPDINHIAMMEAILAGSEPVPA